jgi:type VI secretion system secreted protein VgrG
MTDDDLDRHIRAIIAREGGWVNDPNDSGGPTNYGITLATFRAYCRDTPMAPWTPTKADLHALSDSSLMVVYRWYFRTQGLAELIDEFSIPDELVPLVMDMRTLHSLEGCRRILRDARSAVGVSTFERAGLLITVSRMRYMLEVAERSPKDRKFVRGWMHRALKAIGMWPPEPETREV